MNAAPVASRTVEEDGWAVELDLSPQVLRVEAPERVCWDDEDLALSPTLPRCEHGAVSAAALLLKAKQFDDGLYAAVERAAQHGLGRFPGKVTLLTSLAAALSEPTPGPATAAAAVVHAAGELGRVPVSVPSGLREAVRDTLDAFLRDEFVAKPLGFYTWTAELGAIFRQDRLLQQPLDPPVADALLHAIDNAPVALAAYGACLRLNARLTNPPGREGLRDGGRRRAFFPASRSHEVQLFEQLYGNRPAPERFELMSEMIHGVRSGEVRLEPRADSGWYDHQTWSLEPLVLPDQMLEAPRLQLAPRYRKHLEDLFRGALALARETQVKQAGGGYGGAGGIRQRPIWITPGLTVEPLPSLYARRATTYRFVREVLEEAFGAGALRQMHRMTPEGTVGAALSDELTGIERLFTGASASACRELGMRPLAGRDAEAEAFQSWRGPVASDIDVSRDARMMVPVFHDLGRRKTKVWTFLGWETVPVEVSYVTEPRVVSVTPAAAPEPTDRLSVLRRKFRHGAERVSGSPPRVMFTSETNDLATPVMAEVYVTRLLDRDQFRRHCDRYRTRQAILKNLE